MKMPKEEAEDNEELTAALLVVCSVEGCQKITVRQCVVHGQDLSIEAILTIAQQHNHYNQIQRTITFPKIAAACRRL